MWWCTLSFEFCVKNHSFKVTERCTTEDHIKYRRWINVNFQSTTIQVDVASLEYGRRYSHSLTRSQVLIIYWKWLIFYHCFEILNNSLTTKHVEAYVCYRFDAYIHDSEVKLQEFLHFRCYVFHAMVHCFFCMFVLMFSISTKMINVTYCVEYICHNLIKFTYLLITNTVTDNIRYSANYTCKIEPTIMAQYIIPKSCKIF